MRYLLLPIRLIYIIYGFTLFLLFLFLILPLAFIGSFWGKIRGGNFIYDLCRAWARFVLFGLGIRHRNIYEAPHDPARQYVFVFNHISYLDIPVLLRSIPRQPIRILGKAELARVPLFGFIYRNAVILVERDNPANRARSVVQLKSVVKKGISIVLSPEGTFNMTPGALKEFYDGAFKIAIETQTPLKPILFLDTYNRFSYTSILSLNPGRSRAVYLDEIPVNELQLTDVKALKEKVYRLMEEKLIAYQASWIKTGSHKN